MSYSPLTLVDTRTISYRRLTLVDTRTVSYRPLTLVDTMTVSYRPLTLVDTRTVSYQRELFCLSSATVEPPPTAPFSDDLPSYTNRSNVQRLSPCPGGLVLVTDIRTPRLSGQHDQRASEQADECTVTQFRKRGRVNVGDLLLFVVCVYTKH